MLTHVWKHKSLYILQALWHIMGDRHKLSPIELHNRHVERIEDHTAIYLGVSVPCPECTMLAGVI